MAIGVTFPENEDVVTFDGKSKGLSGWKVRSTDTKKNWAIMLDID